MNSRNSFSSLTITQLVIHLTGALLELYADDTQEIQVIRRRTLSLAAQRPLAASDRPHSARVEGAGRDSHDVRQRACPRFAGQ